MPIRESGTFSPEDIATITAAYEESLRALGLVDRTDPAATMVAKRVLGIAAGGERDPIVLRDAVLIKTIDEYLERAVEFERLAAAEADPKLKSKLLELAQAYRGSAAARATRLGVPLHHLDKTQADQRPGAGANPTARKCQDRP